MATLMAVGETGNFVAAARRIHCVPSAVSIQIRCLEDIVGRTLFVRGSRGVALTPDGEWLFGHACRALALNREAVARFVDAEAYGSVRIGAPPGDVVENLLLPMLRCFADACPGTLVEVAIDECARTADRVRAGELDLALLTTPCKGMDAVWVEPMAWAALRHGRAVGLDPLPLSLGSEPCDWQADGIAAPERAGRRWRAAFRSAHAGGAPRRPARGPGRVPMPNSAATCT